jgi:hypothetical protein
MKALATGEASATWLALREPVDARSRSFGLAAVAAETLAGSREVTVHDIGSGTGSFARWFAPRLNARQRWVLHDRDLDLLGHAASSPPRLADGTVAPFSTRWGELGDLRPSNLADASLVTSSALLDVLTRDEVEHLVALVAAVRAPALFSLTVTGQVRLSPSELTDDDVRRAFNAHQRRTVDGRALLGPDAAAAFTSAARARRLHVTAKRTPWVLLPSDGPLAGEWLRGWIDAAVEHDPSLARAADSYRRRRNAQLRSHRLRVWVDHVDLLVRPR